MNDLTYFIGLKKTKRKNKYQKSAMVLLKMLNDFECSICNFAEESKSFDDCNNQDCYIHNVRTWLIDVESKNIDYK